VARAYGALLLDEPDSVFERIVSLPCESVRQIAINPCFQNSGRKLTYWLESCHLSAFLVNERTMHNRLRNATVVGMSNPEYSVVLSVIVIQRSIKMDLAFNGRKQPQHTNLDFGNAVPRRVNAGGVGQFVLLLRCKGWETDQSACLYITIEEQNWEQICQAISKPQWLHDPVYATADARQSHIFDIFAEIERWLADKNKFEAVDILRMFEVPCAAVLSIKEIGYDQYLRPCNCAVDVQKKDGGSYS
jgi:hypothetical protein